MNVRRYASAAECLPDVRAFLEREEVVANLALGVLTRLAQRPETTDEARRPFYVLVSHAGQPVLLMLRTPPHNMILHAPPPDSAQGAHLQAACEAGVAFLLRESLSIPGVIGPRDVGTRFAGAWARQAGGAWQIQMEQMIYRLDRVAEIPLNPGELIPALEEHQDLLVDWLMGFYEVTLERRTPEQARERAQELIAEQSVYLWVDGQPVSMALRTRPTGNGITVSGVYTPPEFRRRGYATSCVGSLSRLLLAEGYQFCTLYTDLANPTSNSIYQKIGYRPVRASAMIEFTDS
jgi:predicted GNAT family acetyltransferase